MSKYPIKFIESLKCVQMYVNQVLNNTNNLLLQYN